MYLARTDPMDRMCSCGVVGCSQCMGVFNRVREIDTAHRTYEAYGALDVIREPNKVPSKDTIRSTPPSSPARLEQLLIEGTEGLIAIAGVYQRLYGNKAFVDNTKESEFARRLPSDEWVPVVVTRDLRGVAHSVLNAANRKGVPRFIPDKFAAWQSFADIAGQLVEAGAPHLRYEDLSAGSPHAMAALDKIAEEAGFSTGFTPSMLSTPYEHHMLVGNRSAMSWNAHGISGTDEAWRRPDGLSQADRSVVTDAFPDYFERFEYVVD